MQRPIPLSTLLRFPILFGGFLIAGVFAFKYRNQFLEDASVKRVELLRENVQDRKTIEEKMLEMKK